LGSRLGCGRRRTQLVLSAVLHDVELVAVVLDQIQGPGLIQRSRCWLHLGLPGLKAQPQAAHPVLAGTPGREMH